MLPLLHTQHRYYTSELAQTHQQLGRLYRELAKIERQLAEWEERGLNRKEKKKLKWTQTVTKQSVQSLEVQQMSLQQYLRQCNDLIASYEGSVYHLPATPWTAHLPSSPWAAWSLYSPIAPNPWADITAGLRERPQYWDLSMLRERRQSSPNASSADSGFHEPAVLHNQAAFAALSEEDVVDSDHVFAHELMSASAYATAITEAGTRSKKYSLSEKDDVLELLSSPLTSPAKLGATDWPTSPRQRRYSEDAIQLLESRLSVSGSLHQRGVSVGPVPSARRKSVMQAEKEDGEQGDVM